MGGGYKVESKSAKQVEYSLQLCVVQQCVEWERKQNAKATYGDVF